MEKFESILERWMNVEPFLQSEVSQKEKNKQHILTHIQGFPVSLEGKESICNTGDLSSIPEWEDLLKKGMATSYLLQYSCWENSMDRGAWGLQSTGLQRFGQTERLTLLLSMRVYGI